MTVRKLLIQLGAIGIVATQASCQSKVETPTTPGIEALAREYLLLELSVGRHDPSHVDAYFGPPSIKEAAEKEALTLDAIASRAVALQQRLVALSPDAGATARVSGLVARTRSMQTRIELNQDLKRAFDDESEALFGAQAPDLDASHFDAILQAIDELLPGDETLAERVEVFRAQFAIPKDRLAEVFDAAIAECRRRTLEYIELPDNESFTLEYVTDKPWSGYNWYQGNSQSLIQINTDLPIFISRAVDLGCHEGYPGHHTFNALLEKELVDGNGWIEFSLYPLFSPQSLIAEGSGNYGIDLAFPGTERIAFERDVLFPLAGLNAEAADRYYALLSLLEKLDYAGNEAARDYLNGRIDRDAAANWLVTYNLSSLERAQQRVDFFDAYRSYVINYNLGKDLVREYVESGEPTRAERWQRFEYLLSNPLLPSDLRVGAP